MMHALDEVWTIGSPAPIALCAGTDAKPRDTYLRSIRAREAANLKEQRINE